MAQQQRSPLTRETLLRIAREQARITVDDANADALLELGNGLQNEAENAKRIARADVEPAIEYRLEPWPHD